MSDSLESLKAAMVAAEKAFHAAQDAYRAAFLAQYRLQAGDVVRIRGGLRVQDGRVDRVAFNNYGGFIVIVTLRKKDGTFGSRKTTLFQRTADTVEIIEKAAS